MAAAPTDDPLAALRAAHPDRAHLLDFVPVPRARVRRDGWGAERQGLFVLALAEGGSVAGACRTVGSGKGAFYRLLDAPGAESFAGAVDRALGEGRARARDAAIDQFVIRRPVVRRGRLVGWREVPNHRLMIAVLEGERVPPSRYAARARAAVPWPTLPAPPPPPCAEPPRARDKLPRIRFL